MGRGRGRERGREKQRNEGRGQIERHMEEKDPASLGLDDSRRDKKPDDHFGKTKTTLLTAVFSVHCTSELSTFPVSLCSGDHCIDSAHKFPVVAPRKLACSLCSLLLLLGTRISRLVLVCTDGGVSVRQCAPIHEGICGQMVEPLTEGYVRPCVEKELQ